MPSIVILFERWLISFSLSGDSLRFSGINESFEDWKEDFFNVHTNYLVLLKLVWEST